MTENRNYRVEAQNLARAGKCQLRAVLLVFDVVDNAVGATSAVLEPLRRPKVQQEEGDA